MTTINEALRAWARGIDFNADGTPRGISRLATLYPWPETKA